MAIVCLRRGIQNGNMDAAPIHTALPIPSVFNTVFGLTRRDAIVESLTRCTKESFRLSFILVKNAVSVWKVWVLHLEPDDGLLLDPRGPFGGGFRRLELVLLAINLDKIQH